MTETLPYHDDDSNGSARQRFATTSWSLVVQAGAQPSDQSRLALENLCQSYWYPLYVFVRRKGHQRADAEELTQGFFAHLLDRNRLQTADQNKGKFRSFLLRSLENYLVQDWRRENALKRGGDIRITGIDFEDAEQRYSREPAEDLTPEKCFDRKWAIQILDQVMLELEEYYDSRNKGELFEALKPQLVQQKSESYGDIAGRLSISEIAVKVAAHRLRKKFRDLLFEIIGQTVDSRSELEEEVSDLFAALGAA